MKDIKTQPQSAVEPASTGYLKDGRNRPCFGCNEPIGAEAMVVMRPTSMVNETERAFHARCAPGYNGNPSDNVLMSHREQ